MLLIDIFILRNSNMMLLKKERIKNLTTLNKNEPIKIGAVWTFSPYAIKDDFKNGILLAVKNLGKTVLGRKIEVVFKNDESKKKVAMDIAKNFAKDKDIVAVIAHNNENMAIPTSIIYEYSGIIMISPAVSTPDFTKKSFNYIFRNIPDDIVIGRQMANFANFANFKKLIVLNSRDKDSKSIASSFEKQALINGLKIIYINNFNEKEKNFIRILNDISPEINHSIDYDAIFIAGNIKSVSAFIKKAHDFGIYAPFLTTKNVLKGVKKLKAKKEMDGTIVATIYNEELINQKTQNFINEFKKEYGHIPDTWGAQGYDAVMLLAKAIREAGTLDGRIISKQLKYMRNYNSIFGEYSLNNKGDVIGRSISFKIIKNGKFHYIVKEEE